MIGKPNAPWSPSRAAASARGKFESSVISEIHAALPLLQIRPGRPTPGANAIGRLLFARSCPTRDGAIQMSPQRNTLLSASTLQRIATTQFKLVLTLRESAASPPRGFPTGPGYGP